MGTKAAMRTLDDSEQSQQEARSTDLQNHMLTTKPPVWYCPSRWLMAHHDPRADIHTMSSHMCLADLSNDGEHLLALIDFKRRSKTSEGQMVSESLVGAPYDCRLRVYRGQQLIYNHLLDDMPSCLLASSIRVPSSFVSRDQQRPLGEGNRQNHQGTSSMIERPMLTLAINDGVYFYQKFKLSHRLSLEDDHRIIGTLNRSEVDAWQMVKQNKVDDAALHELLLGLNNELGVQELTSHSINYLALQTSSERQNYLSNWRLKRFDNGLVEHLMSMDTICCAAARLRYTSSITQSGDFGLTREATSFVNNAKYNRILDLQRDGLVIGTEDRHLLIYELRSTKNHLESNCRLPATPDHLLVERRSPVSESPKAELKNLTYKILVSCRNWRIYVIDQPYLVDNNTKCQTRELLTLNCNVLNMSWTDDEVSGTADCPGRPDFVVACLDRKVYCFSSQTGVCKWLVELELPITCLISIPTPRSGASETSLVGIASQASRIDFYTSQTGRIVDSIYLSDDQCQAMTFGRFGREDNCLCMTTKLGHLFIFILKRSAKFAHGQCLSSATSHASHILSNYGVKVRNNDDNFLSRNSEQTTVKQLKLTDPPSLPTAFALSKSSNKSPADQVLEHLQSDHNCERVAAKNALDSYLVAPQLQVPTKSRDFVDNIVEQSRHSTGIGKVFGQQLVKLRERIKSTIEQQCDLKVDSNLEEGNRVTLLKITGLGNTYRISLSLRLNLSGQLSATGPTNHLLSGMDTVGTTVRDSRVVVFLFASAMSSRAGGKQQAMGNQCQVKPFKFELEAEEPTMSRSELTATNGRQNDGRWILEKRIECKLQLTGFKLSLDGGDSSIESVVLDVYALLRPATLERGERHESSLVFISSINIATDWC